MELLRDLRTNGHVILAKVVLLSLVALSLYSYGTFVQSTALAADRSLSGRADADVYTLIDRFTTDPEGFERFRNDPGRLAQLRCFIDALDEQPGIRFISSFDQPLQVERFRGDERFDVGYGTEYSEHGEYVDAAGRRVRDVKSIQLNETAFDFAGLAVAEGAVPVWNAVDYAAPTVPVLLGADYRGLYDLGDTLASSFLFRDLDLVVSGFLEPDSAMYFRGEINHFLDDTVVIPYPARMPVDQHDAGLAGLLEFQVLNADLAVDRSLTIDDVLARLDSIAADTGFDRYSITGVPTYFVQLSGVRQLVQDNRGLLTTLLVALVTVMSIALVFLGVVLERRRRPVCDVYRVIGRDPRWIRRLFRKSRVLERVLVLGAFVGGCALLPNQHAHPFLAVVSVLGVWLTIDGITQRYLIPAVLAPARRSIP